MTPEGEFARLAAAGKRAAIVTVVEGRASAPSCWYARTAPGPAALAALSSTRRAPRPRVS
ncbi:MAG: hypothetical protein WKF40_08805 [Thermoleophilaceae bacterium]